MPRTILGLDLSLTDTGVCRITPDGIGTRRVRTKADGTTYASISSRIRTISTALKDEVAQTRPDLVVIESPSFASTTGQAHTRAWLWGKIYDQIHSGGIEVVTASPAAVKMYATGKGNADKDVVLASVIKRYADIDITNNNVADAVVLAAIGARLKGEPIEDGGLPKTHLRALDKLAW
ncbi:RuvC-like Holliday junction resolvase [Gordonia phage Sour]|uniref:RuvC-like resolvase n=1 Tax=Gordonia phage Sour TaxID=2182349 RepID=A0A2U8UKS3_9CAUD|nr:RuvC-like Holliday junction resolvase [Gordonia phage Sour]AWN04210.1 RuvC-like resolvase [Gordonia phage Sour]